MLNDAIIVGGSYAGMAAALQILRARRTVLIVDAGQRRNRFTSRSHGFLAHDGDEPAALANAARRQLEAYPGLTWHVGTAETVSGQRDDFVVTTGDGAVHHGRRLLFATGVVDLLPDVEGLAARWGDSVFHCPYCHGYELESGRIGVIATGEMSVHQAQMLPDWGKITFLANDAVRLGADERQDLEARGIDIEETPIARLDGHADVVLTDGRALTFAGLFTASRCEPGSTLPQELGCALTETPFGLQVQTNDMKETSIAGAFACGDTARVPHSITLAVADGAWAGAVLHRSLVFG